MQVALFLASGEIHKREQIKSFDRKRVIAPFVINKYTKLLPGYHVTVTKCTVGCLGITEQFDLPLATGPVGTTELAPVIGSEQLYILPMAVNRQIL